MLLFCGIPWGCVLFNIYIKTLEDIVCNLVAQYHQKVRLRLPQGSLLISPITGGLGSPLLPVCCMNVFICFCVSFLLCVCVKACLQKRSSFVSVSASYSTKHNGHQCILCHYADDTQVDFSFPSESEETIVSEVNN